MPAKFKTGDKVRMTSDGPELVIEKVYLNGVDSYIAKCWFYSKGHDEFITKEYAVELLTLVPPPSGT